MLLSSISSNYSLITQKPVVRILIYMNRYFPKDHLFNNNYCIKRDWSSMFWKKRRTYFKIRSLNILNVIIRIIRLQLANRWVSMVGESLCIIKQWLMIPLAYCALWADTKGRRKGLLNINTGIVPSNEGSRIRIEKLCLYRYFYFIFKAVFGRCGREDIDTNVVDYCTRHSRPGSVTRPAPVHLLVFFLFCKWKTMAWDLGCVRKSSCVCIILLFGERPGWITI